MFWSGLQKRLIPGAIDFNCGGLTMSKEIHYCSRCKVELDGDEDICDDCYFEDEGDDDDLYYEDED